MGRYRHQTLRRTSMDKTALIIGASRGLGLGLARLLSARGWQLIATARDPQRATELAAIPGVRVAARDIAAAAQVDVLPARLAGVTLDLHYINAGIAGPSGKAASASTIDDVGQLFMINAVASIRLAEAMRPLLNPRTGGI